MIEFLAAQDRLLFLKLNAFHHPQLNSLMGLLSGQLIWLPMIVFFCWQAFRQIGKKQTGLFVLFLALALMASDVTASYLVKNIFNRLRPCREEDLKALIYLFGQKCGGKFGFVSSHAANSMALISFSLGSLRLKRWSILLWILPLVVSYSRIYLGVHYPGDIIGGMMVGLWWGLLISWCFKKIKAPGEL